jgi:hypothetical protein
MFMRASKRSAGRITKHLTDLANGLIGVGIELRSGAEVERQDMAELEETILDARSQFDKVVKNLADLKKDVKAAA